MIGSSLAHLLRSRRAITLLFSEPFYRCHPILTFFGIFEINIKNLHSSIYHAKFNQSTLQTHNVGNQGSENVCSEASVAFSHTCPSQKN